MSTVTATYTDAAGTPATGTVYLSPILRAGTSTSVVVTEKRVIMELDQNGSVSADVLPSDDPSWGDGMKYLVEEHLAGLRVRSYYIEVPSGGMDLSEA